MNATFPLVSRSIAGIVSIQTFIVDFYLLAQYIHIFKYALHPWSVKIEFRYVKMRFKTVFIVLIIR